jgi:hypothetical protein
MARAPLIPAPGAGGIRSVGGLGHHGFPSFPGGFGGDDEGEPIKKFSSAEALQAIMDKIKDEPHLITDNISLVTTDSRNAFRKDFQPAIFDPTAWTRVATHRPSKDEEGNPITGTDLEIREYENDYWIDNGRHLSAEIHTAFGEVTDIKVKCSW